MNPAVSDRILLIEDDGRLAEMVSDYLGQSGFRVAGFVKTVSIS